MSEFGSDGRMIVARVGVGIEPNRQTRLPGEHDMVPSGMIIARMGQGTAQGPKGALLREQRQVFADVQAGCLGGNGAKFTSYILRCIGLHVETLVLREATREEDEDARFRFSATGIQIPSSRFAQRHQVIDT